MNTGEIISFNSLSFTFNLCVNGGKTIKYFSILQIFYRRFDSLKIFHAFTVMEHIATPLFFY